MMNAELATLLAAESEPLAVTASAPFLLDSADTVWWVEAGGVDVFSVAVADDRAAGRRRPFCSVALGGALFDLGAAADGRALLAVPLPDTTLRRTSRTRLRELARSHPTVAPAIARLVDGWIEAVSAGVARDVPARTDVLLELGTTHAVPANARFQARRDVVWVPTVAGGMLFLGTEEIAADQQAWFPVAHHGWLQALVPLKLTGRDTASALTRDEFWDGLARFFATAIATEAMNRRLAEVDDLNRQKDRNAAGERATQRALGELAAVLEPGTPPPAAEVADAWFRACARVGEAQGIVLQPPPEMLRGETVADPLAAIVRASRIRARRVKLDGAWWREDCGGPLLGVRAGGREPVALLTDGVGRWVLVDPQQPGEQPVTAEIAAQLEPFAHVFYRPFASDLLAGWEVLRFGARGLQPEIRRLVLLGLGGGALGALPAVASALVFDTIVPAGARGQLLLLAAGLAGVALTGAVFAFTRGLALLRIEGRMDVALQSAVIDRMLRLPAPFFRGYTAGDLAQRTHAIIEIRKLLANALVTAGLGNLFAWVNLLVLLAINVPLALAATALLLLALAFTLVTLVRQLRVQRRVASLQGRVGGLVLQFITGIAKLRVAGAEDLAFANWARVFAGQKREALAVRRLATRVEVLNAIFPLLASAVIFWLIAPRGDGATLSVGAFLAFTAALATLTGGLVALSTGLTSALNVIPLLERLQPLLQTPTEDHASRLDPGPLTGRIELSRVSFRYAPEMPLILDQVSLEIAPGEFVAIVGASGSGKSTLLRLLLGFERPQSGALHYDGQDFAQLDVIAVRRQLGVVLQTSQPTAGTILSNVAGARTVTEAEAWAALRLAGLEEDVRLMPMGLHTVIPAGGGVLSGGQRQRLMIARAVGHRPRVLLFDEATSALDNRTQAMVTENLERIVATRIVIAHRLSTIRRADRIVVLEAGRIVQVGRYEELVAQPGPFADLAARQRMDAAGASHTRFLF